MVTVKVRIGNTPTSELIDVIRVGSGQGLDFVNPDNLRQRTGRTPDQVVKFALTEMLANALDAKDSTEINVAVTSEGDFNVLTVTNNGEQLSKDDLELILNFENKASSKRGILRVSRGYLGNALKCIFGYSYYLIENKKLPTQPIIIESGSYKSKIMLKPDLVYETIEKDIQTTEREDNGLTLFSVKFPKQENLDSKDLEDIVLATCMVNPTRQISYNILGKQGMYGLGEGSQIRNETSVLWYTQEQFETLFKDYVRTAPNTQIKDFIALFRRLTGKPIIQEILQELTINNHDATTNEKTQFLPTTPLRDFPMEKVQKLYVTMKENSKPIEDHSIPLVLGSVGKEAFKKIAKQNGWVLKYKLYRCTDKDGDVEYPYLFEYAQFDRKEDGQGLKVYQCVNFMASDEDVFKKFFSVPFRCAEVGMNKDTPVTIVLHFVSPVLKWLNFGKSALDD